MGTECVEGMIRDEEGRVGSRMTQGSDLKCLNGRWYSPSLGSVSIFQSLLEMPKDYSSRPKSLC